MKPFPRALAAPLAAAMVAATAACHRSDVGDIPVDAPRPAAATRTPGPTSYGAPDTTRRGYAAADVRFMHHMLMHHAQALVMTAMVPSRSARDDVKLVAERIAISQRDETGLMERWLRARGEPVPSATEHMHHDGGMQMADSAHGGGHASMMASMPGMLTPAEISRLEASTGAAFDTLFVRGMIRHHEGALQMVKEYLATPGAAQEPEIFRFASDIDADQRAEIRRLQALLSR